MKAFEYKVVPAPTRGLKAKGVKGTPARFANALQTVMNDLGAQGWDYQRTDTLPVEERQGLTGKTTTFQNMLVFRRVLETAAPQDTLGVAGLIEDQSEQPVEAAVEDLSTEAEITPETTQAANEADTGASERVNEALSSDFSIPMAGHRTKPRSNFDEDTKPAAE